jgi:hypothetical protein
MTQVARAWNRAFSADENFLRAEVPLADRLLDAPQRLS